MYYDYLMGKQETFPGDAPLSRLTLSVGAGLISLGLIPLSLILAGSLLLIFRKQLVVSDDDPGVLLKILPLYLLFLTNAGGIIQYTLKYPFFAHMKASFFLSSLPAFAVFLALGITLSEKNASAKKFLILSFGTLFLLVTFHIFQIVISIHSHTG